MAKVCERCGKAPEGYALLDYCAECMRDLCVACMDLGCCGHVPAISGEAEDFEAERGPNSPSKHPRASF